MSFLLDTDICSASMKGVGQVANRFIQHSGRLYVSTITLGELFTWALRANAPSKRNQLLVELMNVVQILSIDEDVGKKFGELRAVQLDKGNPTPELDLINGAVALVRGLTMVTHNMKDYANIPGLSLDDWLVP